jgi:hypothetical protein
MRLGPALLFVGLAALAGCTGGTDPTPPDELPPVASLLMTDEPHRIVVDSPGMGWLTVQAPAGWDLLEVFVGYPDARLPDDVKDAVGPDGYRIVEAGTPSNGSAYFQFDSGTEAGFVRYGSRESILSDNIPFPTSEFSLPLGPDGQARIRLATTVTPVSILLMDHVPQGLEQSSGVRDLSWSLDPSLDPSIPLEATVSPSAGGVDRQMSWSAEAEVAPSSLYLLSWTDEGTVARAGLREQGSAIRGPGGDLAKDAQARAAFDYVPGQDYRFVHSLLRAEAANPSLIALERTLNETAPETDAQSGARAFALPANPPA